jgi:ComF family protein
MRAFFGGRCAVCRAWCRGALCLACEQAFAVPRARCASCAQPLAVFGRVGRLADPRVVAALHCADCRRQPPPWSVAVAACDYAPPWDALVAALKFGGRVDLAGVLVPLVLRALAARDRVDAAVDEAVDEGLDEAGPAAPRLVVPVPIAPGRLRERGFNQAWEIARRVARARRLPACADALFRVRDTGHQLRLGRADREANLRHAFVVTPSRAARVRGARVALVDDVLTTGATAGAAARALWQAGATDVRLWVVARTP